MHQAKSKKVKDLKAKSEKNKKNFQEISGKGDSEKQNKEKNQSSGTPKKGKPTKTKPPLMRYVNQRSISNETKSEIHSSVPRRLISGKFDRLNSHLARLKRSIPMNSAFLLNRLQEEIRICTTNLDCAASELEDIVDKVDSVSVSVLAELSPLEALLGSISSFGDTLMTGKNAIQSIILAL